MSRTETLSRLKEHVIAAVVRSDDTDKALAAVQACIDGGVRIIEITFTVPEPIKTLEAVRSSFGDDIVLGAGTVLGTENAGAAIGAGATFVVSPITEFDVIAACNKADVPVMPGAMTPTEIYAAWKAGADIVKVFPASMFGPKFFKAIKAPLPQVPIMPTGGVDVTTVAAWLAAGAEVLPVGGALVDSKAMKAGQFGVITNNARELMAAVKSYREGS